VGVAFPFSPCRRSPVAVSSAHYAVRVPCKRAGKVKKYTRPDGDVYHRYGKLGLVRRNYPGGVVAVTLYSHTRASLCRPIMFRTSDGEIPPGAPEFATYPRVETQRTRPTDFNGRTHARAYLVPDPPRP